MNGTRQHPITDLSPDGKVLQIVQCLDCGQLEVWAEWEIHDHGYCRNATYPPEDCEACGDRERQPLELWWLHLQIISGGDQRLKDSAGLSRPEIAERLGVSLRAVDYWFACILEDSEGEGHEPTKLAQAAIARLYEDIVSGTH